jgi:hypothetical protein
MLGAAIWVATPVAAQQPLGFTSGPVAAADTLSVARPDDVPTLHHTHLNSIDPSAAIAWYVDVWPQGERGEVAGFPAFLADVPVLFTEVDGPPDGGWDADRSRAFPQSPFWHIGAFANTTARFEALEARGHTVLRLARDAADTEGVPRSGLAGDEARPGGFGYLVGPDGALVEITGGPSTDPAFAHVHLFGEQPQCAANWYADILGFALPGTRDPETGASVPRETYEPCEGERADPTWPSLDPAGTIRGPTATIRHGSGSISIYPRQCLGDHCEVDEPLVPSRGQVLDHVAFEVEDLSAWIAWLESRSVTFLETYRAFGPPGANLMETVGSVLVEGPDGLAIELVERPAWDGLTRTLERRTEDRMIHAAMWSPAVRFGAHVEAWQIHDVQRSLGRDEQRTLHLRSRIDQPAQITIDGARGRATRTWAGQRAQSWRDDRPFSLDTEYQRREDRLRGFAPPRPELFRTPTARLWEIAVPWRPDAKVGDAWVDTLAFIAEPHDGVRERLSGVWRHELVGDTTIAGATFPLLRVTADVEYRGEFEEGASLGYGWERYAYDLTGTMSGTLALDPDLGVRRVGADTTRLEGSARLSIDTGDAFTTGAVYERRQTWALSDSVVWAARQDSLRAERRANAGGMVVVDRPMDTTRVAFDSIVGSWRAASSPDEVASAETGARRFMRDVPAFVAEFDSIRWAAGDTARIVWNRLIEMRAGTDPLTAERVDSNAPYLLDPERVWAMGENVWVLYATYRSALRSNRARTGDPGPETCTPDGCTAFVALADGSGVSWLEDLALLDRFWRDPAGEWENLESAYEASGSPLLRLEYHLVQGATGAGPLTEAELAARRFPALDDWRAWLDRGRLPRPGQGAGPLGLWADIEGVDLVEAFAEARAVAESDSARTVFSTWLAALGEEDDVPLDSLATLIGIDDDLVRGDAVGRLTRRIGPELSVDPDRAAALLPRLVDALLDGEPAGFAGLRGGVHPGRQGYHGIRDVPLIVDVDSLSTLAPEVDWSALVRGRAMVATDIPDWEPRDGGVVLRFSPVQAYDRFATVTFAWTSWDARDEGQVERGYAGGQTLWLIRTTDGWRVFTASAWIT